MPDPKSKQVYEGGSGEGLSSLTDEQITELESVLTDFIANVRSSSKLPEALRVRKLTEAAEHSSHVTASN